MDKQANIAKVDRILRNYKTPAQFKNEPDTVLTDLLADIQLWCAENGIEFAGVLAVAEGHAEEEIAERAQTCPECHSEDIDWDDLDYEGGGDELWRSATCNDCECEFTQSFTTIPGKVTIDHPGSTEEAENSDEQEEAEEE